MASRSVDCRHRLQQGQSGVCSECFSAFLSHIGTGQDAGAPWPVYGPNSRASTRHGAGDNGVTVLTAQARPLWAHRWDDQTFPRGSFVTDGDLPNEYLYATNLDNEFRANTVSGSRTHVRSLPANATSSPQSRVHPENGPSPTLEQRSNSGQQQSLSQMERYGGGQQQSAVVSGSQARSHPAGSPDIKRNTK